MLTEMEDWADLSDEDGEPGGGNESDSSISKITQSFNLKFPKLPPCVYVGEILFVSLPTRCSAYHIGIIAYFSVDGTKVKGKGKGKGKGRKKKKDQDTDDEAVEDSDDGDAEAKQVDYMSDTSERQLATSFTTKLAGQE